MASGLRSRPSSAVVLVALVCGLAGCGGIGVDGIALEGKVFDWMGVSEAAQAKAAREPKLTERAPLVMPPDAKRLPAPGSEAVAAAPDAWPDDPDHKRARTAAERERLHREYCTGKRNWQKRAFETRDGDDKVRSPYGPCNEFIGNVFSGVENKPTTAEPDTGSGQGGKR